MSTLPPPGSLPEKGQPLRPNLRSSDPYAVLGLPRQASEREIKRAYIELVRQYSPETDPAAFKLVRAAYEKLHTPETRADTDLLLFQPPAPWQPRKRRRKYDLTLDAAEIWLLLGERSDLERRDFGEDFRPVEI
jgi:curved DNA-binding protein CbpA